MSSAPVRIPPLMGRAAKGATWTIVFGILAAGGAGLVGVAWHPPGSPARAELTYAGDIALDARLAAAAGQLRPIAADVETLATEAKTALGEVASSDPKALREALERGGAVATSIDDATASPRASLIGLPGGGLTAGIEYSNPTLVRRAAILAALDAATGVAARWRQVTGRAVDAAELVSLIAAHDTTVLDATAKGRAEQYLEATRILDDAVLTIEEVQKLRVKLIAGDDQTLLDEWIDRNTAFDVALKALYAALVKSKGVLTAEVQSARREELDAFDRLPPDRRTIIVIVSEVARGGLTQAVLAIEDARGRIDNALAEPG
jgi:hypothetical protein